MDHSYNQGSTLHWGGRVFTTRVWAVHTAPTRLNVGIIYLDAKC